MTNAFFNATGAPATRSSGASSPIRAELASIEDGFDKLPTLAGNANKLTRINSGATAIREAVGIYETDGGLVGIGTATPQQSLDISNTKISSTVGWSGNTAQDTSIPIGTVAQLGGGLVLIRGADGAGVAFSAVYNLAVKVSGGAGADIAAVELSRAGSATPTFTFSNNAGVVRVTAASANLQRVCFIGF